jgi:hypothetical protein
MDLNLFNSMNLDNIDLNLIEIYKLHIHFHSFQFIWNGLNFLKSCKINENLKKLALFPRWIV